MALLNNMYIQVVDEQHITGVDSTSHSVEKGLDITDTVRARPKELSLSGKIVNAGNMEATDIIKKIESLMNSGSLIKYQGRRTLNNMQIQSFNHSHPYTNSGGCDFEITLKKVRIAKPASKAKTKKKKTTKFKGKLITQAKTSGGTKQVTTGSKSAVYHTVKKGNTVYTLVNTNYKSLGKTVQWVVDNNPKCFSKKGDPTTLIIGSKLLMGYKT